MFCFVVILAPSLTVACQAIFDLYPEGSEQGEVVGKRGKKGEEQQEKEAGGEEEKAIEDEGKDFKNVQMVLGGVLFW